MSSGLLFNSKVESTDAYFGRFLPHLLCITHWPYVWYFLIEGFSHLAQFCACALKYVFPLTCIKHSVYRNVYTPTQEIWYLPTHMYSQHGHYAFKSTGTLYSLARLICFHRHKQFLFTYIICVFIHGQHIYSYTGNNHSWIHVFNYMYRKHSSTHQVCMYMRSNLLYITI